MARPNSPIQVMWTQRASFLPFTEPDDVSYLAEHGIVYVQNPWQADVLLSLSATARRFLLLQKLLFWKRGLVWTNEPRFDTTMPGENHDARLIVMNVFSGDVFWHNLHFLGSYHSRHQEDLGIDLAHTRPPDLTRADLERRKGFCLSVFGWRDPEKCRLEVNGKDIDLNVRRQKLAQTLYDEKLGDTVGSHWPAGMVSLEQSGFENDQDQWWVRKLTLLEDYRFNLCLENTAWPYYCTEKIWHAIAAGCLPIYWGAGTRIYETFPRDSFVDAAEFASEAALLEFLQMLTPDEHLARYHRCRKVFLAACQERLDTPRWQEEIIAKFAAAIRKLAG